ncbi:MAG: DUF5343 domain-containing protein [Candidatus Levyibacteriota bacterium]
MNTLNLSINPPYGSVRRLSYMFELFSTHNLPQITPSLLQGRGFSGSDAFQTISSLKFLQIIDEDGNRTEKMSKLQLKGEERTKAILEILKEAYNKLFEAVAEPNMLSKDELHNDFISIYGLSGRLATTAVPNFLWLCKEAGLEASELVELKARKPRTRKLSEEKKNNPLTPSSNETRTPHTAQSSLNDNLVEIGEFKLLLPDEFDMTKVRKAIVKGEFGSIYDALTNLASKLKKDGNGGEVAR